MATTMASNAGNYLNDIGLLTHQSDAKYNLGLRASIIIAKWVDREYPNRREERGPLPGAPAKQTPVDGMEKQRTEQLTTRNSTWAPAWTSTIFANRRRDGGGRCAGERG
ncbi:hypothetical protein TIFTF001_009106 [Ficus carica]|uniref:Uncharacterized protein n=1 Tax=Ficus carica TaxID=3494 RepID=A0AA88D127_FICCA|nr:hypothetical protein TIFTF001_009106 [Ficus carica]